jgi:L,D-transpeptidase YcfS
MLLLSSIIVYGNEKNVSNLEINIDNNVSNISPIIKLNTIDTNITKIIIVENNTTNILNNEGNKSISIDNKNITKEKPLSFDKELEKKYLEYEQIFTNLNPKEFNFYRITIDSNVNKLYFWGEEKGDLKYITEFKVSTGKLNKPKPLGVGKIIAIELKPTWYPTEDTINDFEKRKHIELPKVIEYGDKLNYMGAFKMILTHNINGKYVYRIHGTVNDKTIGRHETGGCIRMRNKEGSLLATFLKKEIKLKKIVVEII